MNEIKVGLFTVAGIIVFAAMVFIVGDISMEPKLLCEVEFPDALGIKKGEKVYLSGLRIGEVTDINYSPPEKRVYLSLECIESSKWPEISEFTIDTMGLMGEKFVGIKPVEGYFLHLENLEYINKAADKAMSGQTAESNADRVIPTRGLKDLYHNEEIMLGFFNSSSLDKVSSQESFKRPDEYYVGRIRRINQVNSVLAVFGRDIEKALVKRFSNPSSEICAQVILARYLPGEKLSFKCRVKRSTPEFYLDIPGIHKNIKKGIGVKLFSQSEKNGLKGFITRFPRTEYKDGSWFSLKSENPVFTRLVVSLEMENPNGLSGTVSKAMKYYTALSENIKQEVRLKLIEGNGENKIYQVSEQGLFYYGTSLVTMGDLMKTGRDVLRKVHSGIETADRLLGHVNDLFESGDLKSRFIRIADNVETGSAGIMSAAVEAKSLIGDLRHTVSSVDKAVKNAGNTLDAFQKDMSRISSGVRDAASEIGALAKTGKKGLDTLLTEAGKLSERIKGVFDKNDTKLSDTLDNFRGASLGFKNIADNLSTALNEEDTKGFVKSLTKSVSKVRETVDSAQNMIDTFENTEFTMRTSIFHNSKKNDVTGDIIATVVPGRSSSIFTLGAGDIGRHGTARVSYGRPFNSSGSVLGHVGVFESRFGMSLDLDVTKNLSIALEVLDPEQFRYNAEINFGSEKEKIFTLRLRDFNEEKSKREFQIGINSYF